MRWLHHASKDSVCLLPDSQEYKSMLESGEWKTNRGEAQAFVDSDNNDALLCSFTDEELRSVAKNEKIKGYHNMKRDNLIIKLKEKGQL